MVNSDIVLCFRWVSKTQHALKCCRTRSWEPIVHQQVKNSQYQRSYFKWGKRCALYNVKGCKRHRTIIYSTVAVFSVIIYSDIRHTIIFFEMVNYGICKWSNKTVYREWCYRGIMPTVKREMHAHSEMKGGRSHIRVTKQQPYHFPSLLNALILCCKGNSWGKCSKLFNKSQISLTLTWQNLITWRRRNF
jgi:hypothetical protein